MDYYRSRLAKLLAPKWADGKWAVTLGRRTFYSVTETEVSPAWRRHEDCHKRQFRRDGFFKFLARYFCQYLKGRWNGLDHLDAYLAIDYEVEARAAEQEA